MNVTCITYWYRKEIKSTILFSSRSVFCFFSLIELASTLFDTICHVSAGVLAQTVFDGVEMLFICLLVFASDDPIDLLSRNAPPHFHFDTQHITAFFSVSSLSLQYLSSTFYRDNYEYLLLMSLLAASLFDCNKIHVQCSLTVAHPNHFIEPAIAIRFAFDSFVMQTTKTKIRQSHRWSPPTFWNLTKTEIKQRTREERSESIFSRNLHYLFLSKYSRRNGSININTCLNDAICQWTSIHGRRYEWTGDSYLHSPSCHDDIVLFGRSIPFAILTSIRNFAGSLE